tara:strand:- start:533 stop:652 length:120 start_codon:yes stop_codon:yes gene_type:complete
MGSSLLAEKGLIKIKMDDGSSLIVGGLCPTITDPVSARI